MRRLLVITCLLSLAGAAFCVEAPEKTVDKSSAEKADTSAAEAKVTGEQASDSTAPDTAQEQEAGAEAQAPSGGQGKVKISSTPQDAVVVVDDVMRGRTPVSVEELLPGEHTVVLKKKGFFLKKATIMVQADTTAEVEFALARPLRLVVTSTPPGAEVSVDGNAAGKTPTAAEKLKAGDHEVVISLQDHETVSSTVSLEDNRDDTLHVELVRSGQAEGEKEAKPERSRKAKLVNRVALGLFLAFALVIVVLELADTKD